MNTTSVPSSAVLDPNCFPQLGQRSGQHTAWSRTDNAHSPGDLLHSVSAIIWTECTSKAQARPESKARQTSSGCLGSTGGEIAARIAHILHQLTRPQPAFLSLVLTFFLSAPLLYITAILFGAPLVSHLPHTALLALHLALLTTPQLFYVHGLDASTWLRLASLQKPMDQIYGLSLGACVGAWLGAIPIPLDWDREWQKWPVTIICGMYLGAVVGKLVGGHLLKGVRMKMN